MSSRQKKKIVFIYEIDTCINCPLVYSEQTSSAGFALDYFCSAVKPMKQVMSYVEWPRDFKEVPDWCPHLAEEEK